MFKFVHNLILVSLEENDLKRSKRVFEMFLKRALGRVEEGENSNRVSVERVGSMTCGEKAPALLMDICVEYIL